MLMIQVLLINKQIKAKQDYFVRIMVAVVCTMNIMMLSVCKIYRLFTGMSHEVKQMIHFAEFLLTTLFIFSGFVFYKGAYFGIKNHYGKYGFTSKYMGATMTYIYSLTVLLPKVKAILIQFLW